MEEDKIQLIPLIPADRFRKHAEDNDQYANLYCIVEQTLQANYDWALSHPEEVNNKTGGGFSIMAIQGQFGDSVRGIVTGNLYSPKGIILQQLPCIAKIRAVKKVAEKLKQAGYKVTYVVEEDRTRHNKEVSEIELDDKLISMSICL